MVGLGADVEIEVDEVAVYDGRAAVELHGWGEGVAVRPSTNGGNAEFGVLDNEVGAVDAERRDVEFADIGVYGEALGYGEALSFMRADFGGTSGGMLPDRSRVEELCLFNLCEEDAGITSGASVFGDMGCFGGEAVNVRERWLPILSNSTGSKAISAFSSRAGPEMQDSILSPNGCCRQLLPGALIERSCSAGRPGIVANHLISLSSHLRSKSELTRIHGNLLYRGHWCWAQFWYADLSSPDNSLFLYPASCSCPQDCLRFL
jgi:hypothetical protein